MAEIPSPKIWYSMAQPAGGEPGKLYAIPGPGPEVALGDTARLVTAPALGPCLDLTGRLDFADVFGLFPDLEASSMTVERATFLLWVRGPLDLETGQALQISFTAINYAYHNNEVGWTMRIDRDVTVNFLDMLGGNPCTVKATCKPGANQDWRQVGFVVKDRSVQLVLDGQLIGSGSLWNRLEYLASRRQNEVAKLTFTWWSTPPHHVLLGPMRYFEQALDESAIRALRTADLARGLENRPFPLDFALLDQDGRPWVRTAGPHPVRLRVSNAGREAVTLPQGPPDLGSLPATDPGESDLLGTPVLTLTPEDRPTGLQLPDGLAVADSGDGRRVFAATGYCSLSLRTAAEVLTGGRGTIAGLLWVWCGPQEPAISMQLKLAYDPGDGYKYGFQLDLELALGGVDLQGFAGKGGTTLLTGNLLGGQWNAVAFRIGEDAIELQINGYSAGPKASPQLGAGLRLLARQAPSQPVQWTCSGKDIAPVLLASARLWNDLTVSLRDRRECLAVAGSQRLELTLPAGTLDLSALAVSTAAADDITFPGKRYADLWSAQGKSLPGHDWLWLWRQGERQLAPGESIDVVLDGLRGAGPARGLAVQLRGFAAFADGRPLTGSRHHFLSVVEKDDPALHADLDRLGPDRERMAGEADASVTGVRTDVDGVGDQLRALQDRWQTLEQRVEKLAQRAGDTAHLLTWYEDRLLLAQGRLGAPLVLGLVPPAVLEERGGSASGPATSTATAGPVEPVPLATWPESDAVLVDGQSHNRLRFRLENRGPDGLCFRVATTGAKPDPGAWIEVSWWAWDASTAWGLARPSELSQVAVVGAGARDSGPWVEAPPTHGLGVVLKPRSADVTLASAQALEFELTAITSSAPPGVARLRVRCVNVTFQGQSLAASKRQPLTHGTDLLVRRTVLGATRKGSKVLARTQASLALTNAPRLGLHPSPLHETSADWTPKAAVGLPTAGALEARATNNLRFRPDNAVEPAAVVQAGMIRSQAQTTPATPSADLTVYGKAKVEGDATVRQDGLKTPLTARAGNVDVQGEIRADGPVYGKGGNLLPLNAVLMWSSEKIPKGWATCDGYNRYVKDGEIFAVDVHGKYFKPDGKTTVPASDISGLTALPTPDLRSRFVVGASRTGDSLSLTRYPWKASFPPLPGSPDTVPQDTPPVDSDPKVEVREKVRLTKQQMRSHRHWLDSSSSAHTHYYEVKRYSSRNEYDDDNDHSGSVGDYANSTETSQGKAGWTTDDVSVEGGRLKPKRGNDHRSEDERRRDIDEYETVPHENRPSWHALYYIIKLTEGPP